jgi:hypothetical protein
MVSCNPIILAEQLESRAGQLFKTLGLDQRFIVLAETMGIVARAASVLPTPGSVSMAALAVGACLIDLTAAQWRPLNRLRQELRAARFNSPIYRLLKGEEFARKKIVAVGLCMMGTTVVSGLALHGTLASLGNGALDMASRDACFLLITTGITWRFYQHFGQLESQLAQLLSHRPMQPVADNLRT